MGGVVVTTEMVRREQKFAWATNVENLIHVPGIGFMWKDPHNGWRFIEQSVVEQLDVVVLWQQADES